MPSLVQSQFGAHAQNYVTSLDHAKGESLSRMLELIAPQSHWRALDIATGGGHTALAFAPRVREVVATDITVEMLSAAEAFVREKGMSNISFREADACALPFGEGEFDLVTCRLASHHFPDCAQFVREMARVLKPDGLAAMIDNVVPPETIAARHINTFEKLRDPSHGWIYSAPDWEAFFSAAGLQVTALEVFQKRMDFERHCDRMAVPAHTRQQLQAMLKHAPAAALRELAPDFGAERLAFNLSEILIIGRAPAAE
jgi:ubiquinone/menaquinone biosynthesis C-methylase UbiE